MEIDRKSRFASFVYFVPIDGQVPYQTSICALFWRSMLLAPFGWLAISGIFVVVSPFIGLLWLHEKIGKPNPFPIIGSKVQESMLTQVVREWFYAVKNRVCPIVTFRSE